jgi:glutathione S-transferase
MELFFSPLACSMATRIALYEANAPATFVEVDAKTKRTSDGADFNAVNPLGLVPTVRTDEGEILTENAAILQWVAERYPNADLGARDATERTRLRQWLCFIGTELHKSLFTPLLDRSAPAGAREYALAKGTARLDHVARHLDGRAWLLDHFTVADAYLGTVLGWAQVTPVELDRWPAIVAYRERVRTRPSFARAFAEELALYQRELARAAQ